MTWAALAVRARGLGAHLLSEDALAAIERASDRDTLLAALAAAGVPVTSADPDAVEAAVRARAALDLATLARWDPSARALDAITLDEDRRSIRAIVRGIAAGVRAERRLEGALPTARLPDRVLTALAACATARELRDALGDHPLADAIDPSPRAGIASIDLFETELALARRYASCARLASNDHAVRAYVAQVIDVENAQAARLLAARGEELDRARAFLDGGERLDRATFLAAAAGPLDETDARLARAFAGTGALDSDDHDHALAWQLATQARLRRIDPHGPAAAIHVLLRRRAEARRIRRAAWRVALGGAP